MTAWVLYLTALSVLFAAGARAAEATLSLWHRPVRFVWILALAGSLAAPIAPWLRPVSVTTAAAADPAVLELLSRATTSEPSEPSLLDRFRAPPALDRAVGRVWIGSAGLALLGLALWFGIVAVAPRRWPLSRLDDEDVRVAPSAGPAVFGLLRPSIVVPRWLLDCPTEVRRLALLHEREHVGARDPVLLAAGAWLAALTPWNPVSWWLLARLRAAVELDCDRRVLRRGASVHAYGAMLLGVAGRTASPRPALALVEPAVLLERRIRAMTNRTKAFRGVRGLIGLSACAAAVLVACSMDSPTAPEPRASGAERVALRARTTDTIYYEVLDRLDRVIGLLRARVDGSDAGIASLEVIAPTRETGDTIITLRDKRAVIERLVTSQEAIGERAAVEDALRRRTEVTKEMLEKLKIEVGEAETVRRLELEAAPLEAPQRPAQKIRIRGALRSGSSPLIYVDGVRLENRTLGEIEPGDIERIEVIKGLAAERQYGDEGRDGVIQIFTKKR